MTALLEWTEGEAPHQARWRAQHGPELEAWKKAGSAGLRGLVRRVASPGTQQPVVGRPGLEEHRRSVGSRRLDVDVGL